MAKDCDGVLRQSAAHRTPVPSAVGRHQPAVIGAGKNDLRIDGIDGKDCDRRAVLDPVVDRGPRTARYRCSLCAPSTAGPAYTVDGVEGSMAKLTILTSGSPSLDCGPSGSPVGRTKDTGVVAARQHERRVVRIDRQSPNVGRIQTICHARPRGARIGGLPYAVTAHVQRRWRYRIYCQFIHCGAGRSSGRPLLDSPLRRSPHNRSSAHRRTE